jgi:hypothetical protein
MAEAFERGVISHDPKNIKALYECADLCRKIRDDKYWDFNNSKTYKTAHKRRQKDIKTLCSLISKHLINWWD